ncbi:MAG: cell division protein [Acidobacteria bacterium]|nr:cell division protein [Acidobacteriota bacterium]
MARDFIPGRREPEVPSGAISYFIREALRRLWISKRTSFVAIAMIAMSLLILGAFLLVSDNLERAVERWQGTSRVTIYFTADVTPQQIQAVDAWLGAHGDLARRKFVTKEQALTRFRSYFNDLSDVVSQLDENPFPPSFECEVAPRIAQSGALAPQLTQLRALSGVDEVQFDWEWIARLRRLVGLINIAGFIVGGILAIAAAFTIANVIRLTMMLYREEIEIMRLVGATERIIRGPFIIEGILQGIIGGIVAVLLLFALFATARSFIVPARSLLWGFLFAAFLPWPKIAGLVAGGMVAGWFGSWLSVRERP